MTGDRTARRIRDARNAINCGKLDVAVNLAGEVLAASPDQLDALEIKALVELERHDDAAAEKTLRHAIAVAPERRWPYADLTRLLMKLARADEAELVARAALQADPDNPDAHATLGLLLAEREMLVPAAAHFERAITLTGPHPDLLLGLGRTLMRQGKLKQALPLLEAAAAARPDDLQSAVCLAQLHERAGRFQEATRELDRAEAIAGTEGADVDLQRAVLLERMGRIEAALGPLELKRELSGAALLQRGRLRAAVGRHQEAWQDWVQGKALLVRQSGRHYSADSVSRQAEALAAFFAAPGAAALPRAARRADLPQPIFIVGFPRSGTTLTEQILASHSAIRAGGELPFVRQLKELAVSLAGGEAEFPAGLANAGRESWPALLRDFYLANASSSGLLADGAAYFTDKMPLNEMWLPLLRITFPESPVILVRRHPLDVLTSVMAHDMTHGFNCAYRIEDAAQHLALVDSLVARYRAAGIRVTHELRYEDLVADPAGQIERLMAAIGLPMEPAQLRFHQRDAVSPTPSYAQVRDPLNDRSIGRWRNFKSELAAILPLIEQALARAGYVVDDS